MLRVHHWDEAKATNSMTDGWILHGVSVRCVFGPRSLEHRHHGELVNEHALTSDDRVCTHGIKKYVSSERTLDPIESYEDIVKGSYFPIHGLPNDYVQRMGLSEYRVLCIHVNSNAVITRYNGSDRCSVQFLQKPFDAWWTSSRAISICLR